MKVFLKRALWWVVLINVFMFVAGLVGSCIAGRAMAQTSDEQALTAAHTIATVDFLRSECKIDPVVTDEATARAIMLSHRSGLTFHSAKLAEFKRYAESTSKASVCDALSRALTLRQQR